MEGKIPLSQAPQIRFPTRPTPYFYLWCNGRPPCHPDFAGYPPDSCGELRAFLILISRGFLRGLFRGVPHITLLQISSHHITSDLITSHHITSHHITSHHITSRHVTSRYVTQSPVTSHHVMSRHVTSHHVMSRHITSRRVISAKPIAVTCK